MPSKRLLWWLFIFTWLLVYAVHQIESHMYISTAECARVIDAIRNQVTKRMNEGKWHTHIYIYIYYFYNTVLIDPRLKLLSCQNPKVLITHARCDKTTLQKRLQLFNTLACLAWILDAKFKLNNTHFMSGHSPGPEVATGTAIRWFVRITEFRSKVGARFTRLAHCVGLLAEFNLTR